MRPEFQAYIERFGIHSLLIVPMRTEGRTIGTIALAKGGASRPYSVEDQAVIQNLADRAGLTITNARLYAENLAQAGELKKTNQELERRVEERTRELEAANGRLQQMAMEDGLTRLANRRHFDDVLEKEVRRAQRKGEWLSLIMADVDFFKRFNDLNGHVAGDGCLQAIGEVLKDVFRRVEELPARYGGEEFAVILPGADAETALQAAEILLKAVEARRIPHGDSDVSPWVTLSVGVVSARVTARHHPGLVHHLGRRGPVPQQGGRPEPGHAGELDYYSNIDNIYFSSVATRPLCRKGKEPIMVGPGSANPRSTSAHIKTLESS